VISSLSVQLGETDEQGRHCSPLYFDFRAKSSFFGEQFVKLRFARIFVKILAEASSAKPIIVEDQGDARALHCRRRAGPGRQRHLAVRVAALLTRPGLQAVELAAKAVAVLGALPSKRRACWRGRGGDGAVAAIAQEHAHAAHGGGSGAERVKLRGRVFSLS